MLNMDDLHIRFEDINQRYIDGRIDSELKFDYLKIDAFKSLHDWKIDNELFDIEKYLIPQPQKMHPFISSRFKEVKFVLVKNKLF